MLEVVLAVERQFKILPAADELLYGSLAFLVLMFVMIKFVGPKMRTALSARTAAIQGQLEEAERTKREADLLVQQYQTQLAEARAEAQRIIDEGKRTADAMRADIVARAEQQAQEILQRAQADAAGERDRAMQQLRGTLGDLSITLASRVIERELSSTEAHRALVDQAIADLSASGNGSRS